jgi:hypothetical protein
VLFQDVCFPPPFLTVAVSFSLCSLQAIVYFSVRAAKEGLTADTIAQELQVDTDTPYQSMTQEGNTTTMNVTIGGNNGANNIEAHTIPAVLDPNKESALV